MDQADTVALLRAAGIAVAPRATADDVSRRLTFSSAGERNKLAPALALFPVMVGP